MINSGFKIIYSKRAVNELQEAINWYNRKKKGLGASLKKEVQEVIQKIISNPNYTSIRYDSSHMAACSSFPYAIHYEADISNKLIRVTAIFHFSRNPEW